MSATAFAGFSVDCRCYGVAFRLRAESPQGLARMTAEVPHGTSFQEAGADFQAQAPEQAGETAVFDERLDMPALRTALMVHVANFAPEYVFVHAGVVAWKGRGLVLPGTSFAGKTTLVAALVKAGCLYYSDEYAVVGQGGQVWPYARDLQVRAPGQTAQTGVDVGELGGHSGTGPLPVALVALLRYQPGATLRLEPVSPGMAVLEMLQHSIPVQRTPARVMAALTTLVAQARCVQAARGEAAPAAETLMALLEQA